MDKLGFDGERAKPGICQLSPIFLPMRVLYRKMIDRVFAYSYYRACFAATLIPGKPGILAPGGCEWVGGSLEVIRNA